MLNNSLGNKVATATLWLAACMPQLAQGQQEDSSLNSRPLPVVRVDDPLLERLSTATEGFEVQQRVSCREIYEHLSEKGKQAFIGLIEKKSGVQSLMLQQDSEGETLLANLHGLITQEVKPAFLKQKQEILESFLIELNTPGELNQAGFGVCGVGLIYQLYIEQPAEATRLMAGLLSEESKVKTRGGDVFELARYVIDPDPTAGRSVSEKIFQSALMELANGTEKAYCNHCDEHFSEHSGEIYGPGLFAEQIQHLYESVLGLQTEEVNRAGTNKETVMTALRAEVPGFVPASVRWNTGLSGTKLKRLHITHPDQRGTLGNEPHHSLAGGSMRYGKDGNHFILVTKIEAGRVYYRNLHGPSKVAAGTLLINPPRVMEDPRIGIESMSEAEFANRVNWILKFKGAVKAT